MNDDEIAKKRKKTQIIYMGHHSYGLNNIRVRNWGEDSYLSVGSYCSFADRITVFTGGNHYWKHCSTFPFQRIFTQLQATNYSYSNGCVTINNDVWVGSNVTIMSGVTISNGAVLAAGTQIISTVEPFAIYGGNPGKLIRYRFRQEIIDKIQSIAWWNYDLQKHHNGMKIVELLSRTPSIESLELIESYLEEK
jgi:acetyltransferase-like isoleucine patch superfamily enzyme